MPIRGSNAKILDNAAGVDMGTPPVERKLAAILSVDVAGYTRLMSTDEAGTLKALSEHRQVVDELIGHRGGHHHGIGASGGGQHR